MDKKNERRANRRVDVFPQWEERDIHRIWLFHDEEPGAVFALLLNYSRVGGCMILHKQDVLPQRFRFSLLDPQDNHVCEGVVQAEQQWEEPYFAGFKRVGFSCQPLDLSADEFLQRLERRLDQGAVEYLRCRIIPC